MNELTMQEKLILIGLLGVAYDRKVKLMKNPHVGQYLHHLKTDLESIRSISDKLVLDIDLPETVESA